MAKNVVRSLRIDDDLKDRLDRLPDGTVNTLVNELLELYFEDDDVQGRIVLRDNRFDPENWKPELADATKEDDDVVKRFSEPVETPMVEPPQATIEQEVMAALGAVPVEEPPLVGAIETIAPSPEEPETPTEPKPEPTKTNPLDELFGF